MRSKVSLEVNMIILTTKLSIEECNIIFNERIKINKVKLLDYILGGKGDHEFVGESKQNSFWMGFNWKGGGSGVVNVYHAKLFRLINGETAIILKRRTEFKLKCMFTLFALYGFYTFNRVSVLKIIDGKSTVNDEIFGILFSCMMVFVITLIAMRLSSLSRNLRETKNQIIEMFGCDMVNKDEQKAIMKEIKAQRKRFKKERC